MKKQVFVYGEKVIYNGKPAKIIARLDRQLFDFRIVINDRGAEEVKEVLASELEKIPKENFKYK